MTAPVRRSAWDRHIEQAFTVAHSWDRPTPRHARAARAVARALVLVALVAGTALFTLVVTR